MLIAIIAMGINLTEAKAETSGEITVPETTVQEATTLPETTTPQETTVIAGNNYAAGNNNNTGNNYNKSRRNQQLYSRQLNRMWTQQERT